MTTMTTMTEDREERRSQSEEREEWGMQGTVIDNNINQGRAEGEHPPKTVRGPGLKGGPCQGQIRRNKKNEIKKEC